MPVVTFLVQIVLRRSSMAVDLGVLWTLTTVNGFASSRNLKPEPTPELPFPSVLRSSEALPV
eukprot:2430065-Rhodomonas_salina.1